VVDAALKTDDVLTRTIDDLDLRMILSHLSDQDGTEQDGVEQRIDTAVTQAVRDSLVARMRALL
jgi:hypothetical protein